MRAITTVPAAARSLLEHQSGVISREQALGLGLTDDGIASLVKREIWRRLLPAIYLRGVESPTTLQLLWAGHLCAGERSAVGGRACSWLYGIGDEPSELRLWTPPNRTPHLPHPNVVSRDRLGRLAHRRGTLPRMRVEDALLDEHDGSDPRAFVSDVTDALRLRATSLPALTRALDRRGRQAGRRILTHLLADLCGVESDLERCFHTDVVRAHGLPEPARQVWLGASRVDTLYEEYGLVVEIDGRLGYLEGRFRDYDRDNRHAALGLITLRFGSYDLRGDPCGVATRLATVLTRRGWPGFLSPCRRCRRAA